MSERGALGLLIIVLLVLIFAQPNLAWPIRRFLDRSSVGANSLALENATLRGENTVLKERLSRIPAEFMTEKIASVYVRYPFNYKKEILIDAGRRDDVRVGDSVLLPDPSSDSKRGVFIGRVEDAQDRTSLVQLVFDSRLRMGVRIGEEGTESLLIGGDSPRLTLIPKTAPVHTGDIVLAAAPDFPYGLVIGEVKDVTLATGGLLQEATIRFPYELNDIKTVIVGR